MKTIHSPLRVLIRSQTCVRHFNFMYLQANILFFHNQGRFPFDQKFRNFRFEIEWNGKNSGKSFRKFRNICFECTLFVGISGIIENFVFHSQEMSGLVSLPSVGARTIQFSSLFATLQRNSSVCFSGKIAGRRDKLPVDSAQCALFLVSITDTFPSHPEMVALE